MISVRQSFLEQFRRVVATSYGDEQELIDHIRGKDKPNWMMQAGTAWHALLAMRDFFTDDPDELFEEGGYRFLASAIDEARVHVGPGLCDVPSAYRVDGPHGEAFIQLTGTADHIHGLTISDHKTKFTTPDASAYETSLQWRVYLLLHECQAFQYNLFHFKEPKDGYCELKDILSFRFWRYPGMEAEVLGWLARFVEWAGDLGLLSYLDTERRAA